MVNPDDYLEMAATRYVELIWKIELDRSTVTATAPLHLPSPHALRHAVAACLRWLADVIQSDPEPALADRLALTR